eukprot:m.67063 g.67063  ORF g.67063 m.67063 type:complete len:478 (-) comp23756_c0_seq3:25-1458(-)
MMFKTTLLLLATAGSVNGALYTWAGRSTDFSKALNWDGPSPIAGSGPSPGTVSVGTEGAGAFVSLLGSNSFNMGQIVFDGPATLILGGDSPSVLTFDKDAASQPGTSFTPSSDFKCNQNWMVTENGVLRGAPVPPCGNDEIIIPAENSYYVEIPEDASISKVTFLVAVGVYQTSVDVTSCGDGDTVTAPGSASSVSFEGGCDAFKLGAQADKSCPTSSCTTTMTSTTETVTTATLTTATLTSVTTATVTSATITSVTTATQTSATITSVTTATLTSATDTTPTETSVTETSVTSVTTTIGAAGVEGNVALTNTSAGMGIIVGIVLLVVICIVVVVVFVVLRGKKSSKDSPRNIASFDNPMYDDVSALNINGTSHANTGEANGYMDIPANNDDNLYDEVNLASGYMDVKPEGVATGYMDVNPNQNDDDEDSEDFDDETYDEVEPEDENGYTFDDDDDDNDDGDDGDARTCCYYYFCCC